MAPATLDAHAEVRGVDVAQAEVRANDGTWVGARWADLDVTPRDPGDVQMRVRVDGGPDGADVQVPPCAGRRAVTLDGLRVPISNGPVIVHVSGGTHAIGMTLRVSPYERRIACGEPVRVGTRTRTVEGLSQLTFASARNGEDAGHAVVYVPPGHDAKRPGAVLVGLHPWSGTMWTYASYAQLLGEARDKDVVLLMPSGLGNSLYTAEAEDEVMSALDALETVIEVDPQRVSLWGASMGGAGATTIGFHHPDRFASIVSFFGDSRYDLTTYVRSILHDEAGAHAVNALDVVDNARWVPVWLIHGEQDRTSPVRQSEILADALTSRGFSVRFDRVPDVGHAGALVARFLSPVVDRAATAQAPGAPVRVTYRSVRPSDTGAYGLHIARARATADAFVDVERRDDGVHVRRADGVRALTFDPGALGTDARNPSAIVNDTGHTLDARWLAGT